MKPDKKTHPKAYKAWVRAQLKDWDPADDRGGPQVYVPRFNGIRAADIENNDKQETVHHEPQDS